WEHHLSPNLSPATGSADATVKTDNTVESAAAKPRQMSVRLLMNGPGSMVEMLRRAGCDRQVFGGPRRPFSWVAARELLKGPALVVGPCATPQTIKSSDFPGPVGLQTAGEMVVLGVDRRTA